jgi:hypothetical protein
MQSPRSRRAGDDKERRQKGFLPDFREAIKAARGPRQGNRLAPDLLHHHWGYDLVSASSAAGNNTL